MATNFLTENSQLKTKEIKPSEPQTDDESDSSHHSLACIVPPETLDDRSSCIIDDQVKDNTVKILCILPNGTQRLITFETPNEDCNVQDLLQEAKIPISEDLSVLLVTDPTVDFNYVAKLVSGTDSFSQDESMEENNGISIANNPTTRTNDSVEIVGSLEESCSDYSMTQNWRLNGEGDKSRDAESREKNRQTSKTSLFEEFESLILLLDKDDREEGKLESTNSTSANLRNTQNEMEIEGIPPKERVIIDNRSNTMINEPYIDHRDVKEFCEVQDMVYDSTIQGPHVSLICRTVILGTYSYAPRERIIISKSGIRMEAPLLEDNTNFVLLELKFYDILKVVCYFGEIIPCLFFYMRTNAGLMIRDWLGMQNSEGPYYNPFSKDPKHRRITLLLQEITEESKFGLKTLFPPNKLLNELNCREAAILLLAASPRDIRPQIKSLILKVRPMPSTVDNTINGKLKALCKKPQHFKQDSENIEPAADNSLNGKIKKFDKMRQTSLKRPRQTESIDNNPTDGESQTILVYPPPPVKGGIPINLQDYSRLREGQFLNDVIIDFYLKYLSLEVLSDEDRNRTHIFSTHFYNRLINRHTSANRSDEPVSPAAKRHANVRNWTKKVNIFEKDFIVIPINKHAHWFVAIICFPGLVGNEQVYSLAAKDYDEKETIYKRRMAKELKLEKVTTPEQEEIKKVPCILIFDSLTGPAHSIKSVTTKLREYLTYEYLTKLGVKQTFSEKTIKGACPEVPQQSNFSDCGVYVLQYAESFFANPIKDYTLPIKTLNDWFDEVVVNRKRKQLSKLLRRLMKRQ